MKDMTQEWAESIKLETTKEQRSYTLFGEREEIPDHIFEAMIQNYKYYEMKNVKEIIDNYDSLIIRQRLSFRTMMWIVNLMGKIAKKMRVMKEYMALDSKYGSLMRELYGTDYKMSDILTRKMSFPAQLILTDVKLENFQHIQNLLFSAYKFDVIDIQGNKIDAVFVYEEFFNQVFSPRENIVVNRRVAIETARSSMAGKTWIIYAMAMTEHYKDMRMERRSRNKRLFVRHIQEAGSSIKPDMPFLMIK